MPESFQNLLDRVGGVRQAAIILVGVLVSAGVYGVSQWAAKPVLVSLVTNVPAASVGKMTTKLSEVGISYKLADGGNSILVDSNAVAKARVELSSAGLVDAGRPGLELFDRPAWGMTDFTQKVNFRRAMEGELERNIASMTDVKSVQVHLALEDDQIFKQNERPSKASVTLTMQGGTQPPAKAVLGIQRLVAGSVGGLTPDNVTIVDERGQALTMDDPSSPMGLTSRQLAQQREVEQELRAKIEPLLTATYGAGNARVQLSADLNFDRVERNTQSVDPDKQALTNESKQEVIPGAPTQGAASNNVSSNYDYTRSTESFVASVGGIKKLTVAVLIADKVTYPAPDATAAAKGAPAAPPVITARTPAELARVDSLVRRAIGADSTRGDAISVVSAPFFIPEPVAEPDTLPTPTIVKRVIDNPKPVVTITAIVGLLVVAMLTLGALRQKAPKSSGQSQNTLAAGSGYAELPSSNQMNNAMQQALQSGGQYNGQNNGQNSGQNGMRNGDSNGMQGDGQDYQQQGEERRSVVLPAPMITEEREQAIATVAQRPDAAIRVSKAWLRADR